MILIAWIDVLSRKRNPTLSFVRGREPVTRVRSEDLSRLVFVDQ